MVRTTACVLAAAVLVSVLAAACGGDGGSGGNGDAKTVSVPTAAKPPPGVTGDGAIDQIITAALVKDDIALAALAGYERVACKTGSAQGAGAAPVCRGDEADGASVEVLASSACTNSWIRPEAVPDVFAYNLAPGKPELVTVIKPRLRPEDYGGGFSATAVVVVRSRFGAGGQPEGVALHLRNGRVVWIEASCRDLAELIAPDRVEAVIFDPTAAAPASSPASATATATSTP